jgi:hypothetical protein
MHLSRRGELGDGLGSLRNGVLGKLPGEHEADCGLDLARRKGRLLVVTSKTRCLSGDALEDVVDERVHDRHASLGDASLRVHLFQDFVDVRRVRLDPLGATLASDCLLRSLDALLSRCLCHFDRINLLKKLICDLTFEVFAFAFKSFSFQKAFLCHFFGVFFFERKKKSKENLRGLFFARFFEINSSAFCSVFQKGKASLLSQPITYCLSL